MNGLWRGVSLRSRLLGVLLTAVVLSTAVATGATYYWARHEIDQLLDYHLRQQALALRDKAFMLGTVVVPEPDPDQDFVIQAWDWRGQRVYLSHRGVVLPRSAEPGYSDIRAGDTAWRVYAMVLGTHLVQIAQPMRLRRELATEATLKILYPLLAILPILALLVWWSVGRVLSPLGRLAQTIASRDAATLAPINAIDLPHEARLMVEALNDLIARLQHSLTRERAFMADAAHELRTPLTALQLQAQLLARAGSAEEQAEAAAALRAGVQRAAHLIDRLLAYARADLADESVPRETLDFSALASECVQDFAERARAQGLELHVAITPSLRVSGQATALRSVVSNLLENALRYTPSPGRIALDLTPEHDRCILQVTDTGPGIPPAERTRIFDRFYRIPGTATEGSGLGLAIVRRVVERHRGEVMVASGPGGQGACFRLSLPLSTGPSAPASPGMRDA